MSTTKASGIIWVGPIYDRGGYGNVSRNYVIGLNKIGIPVRVVNIGSNHDGVNANMLHILKDLEKTNVGDAPIGVVHYVPDIYPRIKFRNVVKTVGCTIFETDRIPSHWVPLLNNMDEIWVPSKFNYNTFSLSGVDPNKIRVIPYSVDPDFYRPMVETFFVNGRKNFTFLYIFAFGWRKGFDILLEAYCREFTSAEDVTLILKVYGWGNEKADITDMILHSIKDRVDLKNKGLPHFVILPSAITQEELRLLYNTCDLYISTDRANGWGMPCMEAMSMGKPAATINWSGSTEFMNEHNSLLIQPSDTLIPVDYRLSEELPNLYSGHRWPEVKIEEVSRVMRFAYEHKNSLKGIAQAGMQDIRERYSLTSIAERIQEALFIDSKNNRLRRHLILRRPDVNISVNTFQCVSSRLKNKIKRIINYQGSAKP